MTTTRLSIKATPKSSKTAIAGWEGDTLRIRIAAPPDKGQANQELLKFLSKTLGLSRSKLCIISGETSRRKIVEIEGLNREEIEVKVSICQKS